MSRFDIPPEWKATYRKGRQTRSVGYSAENEQAARSAAVRMAYRNEEVVSVEKTREGRDLPPRRRM